MLLNAPIYPPRPTTSITLWQVNKVADQIQGELDDMEVPPTLRNNIKRLIGWSIANTAELIQTKRGIKLAQELRNK